MNRYRGLFHVDDFKGDQSPRRLDPIKLEGGKGPAGYDERWLQQFLAHCPDTLPIADIEPVLEGAVPVCLELPTAAGYVDLLLVTPRGDLVLVECKLWRNPQAQREVIGQILDYAKELPRLNYQEFQDAVQKAEPAPHTSKSDSLYARVCGAESETDEPTFIDGVIRNLRRGRFLLLIVGDGIREGVVAITDYVQEHAGMHFTLGLVEVAIFKAYPSGLIIQPRVLARTITVERGILLIDDGALVVQSVPKSTNGGGPKGHGVPKTISEERLFEDLDAREPGLSKKLKAFIEEIEPLGVVPQLTPSTIVLQTVAADRMISLGNINAACATIWFSAVVKQAEGIGLTDAAIEYYRELAGLIAEPVLRKKKLEPGSKTGTAELHLRMLLEAKDRWLEAIQRYLAKLYAFDK